MSPLSTLSTILGPSVEEVQAAKNAGYRQQRVHARKIFGAATGARPAAACTAQLNLTAHTKVACARNAHADQPLVRHVALLVGDPVVSWMTDEHHDPIDVQWAPHAKEFAA